MAEAQRKGHFINFDVLYYTKSQDKANRMVEIGEKEGEYIRMYHPILNTQIPHEDNWRSFDTNTIDAKSVLADILLIKYGRRTASRQHCVTPFPPWNGVLSYVEIKVAGTVFQNKNHSSWEFCPDQFENALSKIFFP